MKLTAEHLFQSLLIGLAILAGACGQPDLEALDPNSGGPHTLVDIEPNEPLATIYWNAGTADEQAVPRRFFGGGPFSVPHGSAVGDHPVQLERDELRSANVRDFTVTDPALTPFPDPRLEYITIMSWTPTDPDTAQFLLFAQGANVDVGAEILIDGRPQDTFFWQGLRNDLRDVDPTTLAYSAYHYGLLVTVVEAAIGSNLNVSIRNLGGARSVEKTFRVPAEADLDSDGDGLLDVWEANGYDADADGTVDVDLPALGADPLHKDLFVEVDFMNGKVPAGDPWTIVEQAFASAPILNASGRPGIHLHIDRGQPTFTEPDGTVVDIPAGERGGGTLLEHSNYVRYDDAAAPCQEEGETTVNFHALKSDAVNFAPGRLNVFHYAIIGDRHGYNCRSSGRGEIWGNDLFVTLRDIRLEVPALVAGTFMHELGHNLRLLHGGGDDGDTKPREPNHVSVMSYYSSTGDFVGSYQAGGVDIDCDRIADGVYDYSRGALRDLEERRDEDAGLEGLDERFGICNNVAIDWNGIGGSAEIGVQFDIDGNGELTTLNDFNSWGRLYLDFRAPGAGWGGN